MVDRGSSIVDKGLASVLADRYRIEREIGAGGMATVYLAQDIRHGRQVAIKVLKPELAAVLGAERFVTEIRTTAALQHPHILPLFDSGTADGLPYYVMPFIAGETVRHKLNRETQFSITEATRIASEVADALEYAHQHGVIHRDIKPENILLANGHPIVADFGIALAVSAAAGGRMTESGLSLGTPHYMSPEQATAEKEITARSDIYSLGSVLYEMLTGQPPHLGGSAQQIVMKIIAEEVAPVTKLRKAVPTHVAAAVAKAVEKLPADRFESAKAFAEALGNPEFRTAQMTLLTGAAEHGKWKRRFQGALLVIAMFAVGLAAASRDWLGDRAVAGPEIAPMHLRLWLPPTDKLAVTVFDRPRNAGRPSRTAFALSPGGDALVYAGERDGKQQLFLRPLIGETVIPIPGTDSAETPFYSPDGKSIGFWTGGLLRRLTLPAGPVTDIGKVGRIVGASWSSDDRIVVGLPSGGLVQFSLTGSVKPDTLAGRGAVLPQFLPGNDAIVFTRNKFQLGSTGYDIALMNLTDRTQRTLVENAADAHIVPTGHLLFVRDGQLMAVGFDAKKMQTRGDPVVIIADLMQALGGSNDGVITAAAQLAISRTGQLAYLPGGISPDAESEILWIDHRGIETPLPEAGRHRYLALRLSPDGKEVAATIQGVHAAIQVFDLARRTSRFITTSGEPSWLLWSPDGKSIVYNGRLGDSLSVVRTTADGSRKSEALFGNAVIPGGPAFWSTDGKELFVTHTHGLRLARVVPEKSIADSVVKLRGQARYPALSPDGKWIAYGAIEPVSGFETIFVQDWPTLERKWKVSRGSNPVWTKQGRELTFLVLDSAVKSLQTAMAVDLPPGSEFSPGIPKVLFTARFGTSTPLRSHDVAPDGSRFLVTRGLPSSSPPPGDIHLIVNWFVELKRLMDRKESAK